MPSSLGPQNSRRDFGIRARAQFSCRCQKQPWTKTAFLRERNTRSGHPGKSLAWSRYRYPMAKTSLRTSSSGRESLERTRAMTSERSDGVMVSTRAAFLQTAGRTTGCPHYSTIKRSITCANYDQNPLRNYGEMRDFRIGNWRAEEPVSPASTMQKHNKSRYTPSRPGRNPPANRREPTGRFNLVWPSERSASEKINERPVAQATLIGCLLSGA